MAGTTTETKREGQGEGSASGSESGERKEANGEVKGGGGGERNETAAANSSSQFLQVPNGAGGGGGGGGATIGDGGDEDEEFVPTADHTPDVMVMELKDLEEAVEDRDQWGNPLQFFCTILGFCVGLGNIWRFPYLCQAHGGGAFVFPFLIMIVIEGAPLMLLELALGQRMRKGSYICWNMIHPCLGGMGIGSTIIGTIIGCYYNMIIAWCLYYLVMSIRTTLPWSECPLIEVASNAALVSSANATVATVANATSKATTVNATEMVEVPECADSSETQYYWYRVALDITDNISETGGIRWWMLVALTVAWLVVYLIIRKGIASSGKVVYFTAFFPYVVLTIFLIRGLTLKGAFAGIMHMFTPDMEKLKSPTVWLEAANQVFFSFSLAFGSIIGFGSYNPMDKNCVFDTYAISIANALTALYAGIVIFSILGFKAWHIFEKCMEHDLTLINKLYPDLPHYNVSTVTEEEYADIIASLTDHVSGIKNCSMGQELNKAAQGTGLAFIVMTDVFTMLPGAPFWSFLFFAMLLALGLGSQIGILEGVTGTFFDMPQFKNYRKTVVSGLCCLFCYFVGILFTTCSGEYWLSVIDKYIGMGLSIIAFCEIMSVMYVYGHRRFTDDIYQMTGTRPGPYWQITWRFLAPLLVFTIMVSSIISESINMPVYAAWNRDKAESEKLPFPPWSLGIAVALALGSLMPLVVVGILRALKFYVLPLDVKTMSRAAGASLMRVATDASTNPLMPHVESFHDIPVHQEDQA